MEAWLLVEEAKMESIKTEVQGMIAANQYRLARGEVIAYNEDAFQKKADVLHEISVHIARNR